MKNQGLRIIGMFTAIVLTGGAAVAQDASVTARLQRQLQQAEQQYSLSINPQLQIGERAMIDYGGLIGFGFLSVDDSLGRNHVLRQTDGQLYGYLNIDGGVHEAFGRLRFTYQDFNSGDSFRGDGDRLVNPLSDRYWYKFDLRRAVEAYHGEHLANNLWLRVGRQYIEWGSGLTFSDQLYAADINIEINRMFNIRALIGTTPESSVIDFDSSRPSFDGETNRLFLGGQITMTTFDDHQPYFFVLRQWDNNQENTTPDALNGSLFPTTAPTRFFYESTYWGIGSNGKILPNLSYQVEGVWESGRSLSNSYDPVAGPLTQTEESVAAWAARAKLTWNFFDENLSRIEFETLLASGDGDRQTSTTNTLGGNQSGTKDHAFNGFGYINTGMAYAAPMSNLMMFRLGASTFPLRSTGVQWFRRLQVGTDLFMFNKLRDNAPINEASTHDGLVGFEPDVYLNWRFTSDVALIVRYGAFLPGDAISGDSAARHFFYSGLTYSF